ncbi:hypothetical protein SBOR_2467 [Sclerotinia borealis F-4128]|uniref:Uncharacterized protein n=1 Tax=Sclerotinia borealis (strain F-4128) TaxID=1432307 RepID=W9CRC9_SCLBF|nr:hypothetical protein SBOR_2467 [Sclerotinia borealis F-4128]
MDFNHFSSESEFRIVTNNEETLEEMAAAKAIMELHNKIQELQATHKEELALMETKHKEELVLMETKHTEVQAKHTEELALMETKHTEVQAKHTEELALMQQRLLH